MGRNLSALAVVVLAFLRGDLLHPSPWYSLWLPLMGLAAFLYLMLRLLSGRAGARAGDGAASGDGCDWGGDCGGDGGGGD